MANFASSYIKTEASSVTRASDVITIDGTVFSDFYRHEGFSVVSFDRMPPALDATVLLFNIGEPVDVRRQGSSYRFRTEGVATAYPYLVPSASESIGAATAFQSENSAMSINGLSVVENNSTSITTLPSKIHISGSVTPGAFLNGPKRLLAVFPKRLPNATLQQLSALVV